MRRVSGWLYQGITLRRACAGTLLVLGLGRLGVYQTMTQTDLLSKAAYGWLLVLCAAAMLATESRRRRTLGRLAAFLAACVLATLAVDFGTLSTTFALFAWWAVCCAVETVAFHD